MSENKNRTGWTVLGAAIGINFFSGLGYIWSIVGKELMRQLQWSSLESTLPYTVFTMAFAISMALAGPIQDRRGPRFVATLGGLLTGGGLILTGFALKPALMVVTFGIMTGFGIGSMYAATVPPALKWFSPAKKGMINGVVVAMVALASVMYSPLTHSLMDTIGIAKTFRGIGIGNLVILTGLAQLLKNPPEGYVADPNAKAKVESNTDMKPREMLRTADFYKMWLMFVLSAASGLMIIGQAANIAKVQAHWEGGFILVIFLAVFNAIGRSIGGSLSDTIGRANMMRLTFIVQACNIFLFSLYTNHIVLMIGVAIAGMCYGCCMVVFSASTADLYGMKNFGANYGLVYTAWGVAGVVGPLPSSIIFDATKSFNSAYLLSGGLVVIALIIALTFKGKSKTSRTPNPKVSTASV